MIAIIPARSGSKGLPGKNIKLLNGKPLIAHTIEAAKKSKYINRIIVSTNDQEIADISKKNGADVPFLRPENLAADNSLAIDNYIFTINKIEQHENISIENFIVLQPTSPLRNNIDIDKAIELFFSKNADSIISYTKEEHPVFWHKKINKDLSFCNVFQDELLNRQDFEETYFPNGAIYIFSKNLILNRKYYSDKSYAYIMPRERSIDIDTLDDFLYAEFLLSKLNNS
jgi:CMP-N,N'-diacetyllegionaminic acid synthase